MIRYFCPPFGKERLGSHAAIWLFLGAVAVSCHAGANPGNAADSGITNMDDATPSGGSSGASTGSSGSDGSTSGANGHGSSSGASGGGSSSSSIGAAPDSGASGDASGNDGATVGVEGGAAGGCSGKPYKLCEDFESGGAVGAVPNGWQALPPSATHPGIGLANDQAHSGTMSLKSDSMNRDQERVEKSLATLGPTATKHWGRIFYKVGTPAPKPNVGVIHITFTALEGTTENRVIDTVVDTTGHHQWLFNIPDDSCCSSSAYDWTFDTSWHCAEWTIDVAAKSYRFFSDGKEVTQLAFAGRAGAMMSNYTNVALGTIFYQSPPNPVVVWFDDLAIDDIQIGCQ